MSRTFTFFVNPASGGGRGARALDPVLTALRARGVDPQVVVSPGPVEVATLAGEAAARGEVVVSVGGDGMLSHLIGAVAGVGGTLAVVPAGRGNDFARMLQVPTAPGVVAAMLIDGEARPTDVVRWSSAAGSGVIAGSVYCGIDARAAGMVHGMRWTPTALQYPMAALRAIAGYAPGRFRISVDGDTTETLAGMVVVANSAYYGKGMKVAPGAQVDDGLLDVVIVAATSRSTLVKAFPSIYNGSHVHRPEVSILRGRCIELAADATPAVSVGADGEPLPDLPRLQEQPLRLEVLPGVLNVVR